MKTLYLFCFLLVLIPLTSCSSSDNSEGVMEIPGDNNDDGGNEPNPAPVSYSGDIQPIIRSNCTSCHGNPPTNNAPMSLLSLEDVQNAITNRRLLTRINSTSAPMPPTGLLPRSSRQLIEDWADLGFPE